MIKGIIFDFDGTLVDTEEVAYQATKQYLQETYNVDYSRAEYRKSIGSTDGLFYQQLELLLGEPVDAQAMEACFAQAQKTEYPTVSLRTGIAEFIAEARKKELKLAIVSNSRKAELMQYFSHHYEFMSMFETIVTRDDVKQGKPHPEGYRKCLAQLGLAPNEVIAVEDSPTGMRAALDARLKVLAYPNDFTKEMNFPAEVILVNQTNLLEQLD